MFKILGDDGKEYGPVSAEILRQWIAERRADAQTLIQAADSLEFKPLGRYPEFQSALAATVSNPPSAAVGGASVGPPSTSLATTSMILGICSFCLLIFTAIPAIITGHTALSRIRRDPAQFGGRGLATAGLVMAYLSLLLLIPAILAGLLLPALAKAKEKAKGNDNATRIACVNNLKRIGLSARMYANNDTMTFPPNFGAMSNQLVSPKLLVCPGDTHHSRALDWTQFSEKENVSYEYLPPGVEWPMSPQKVVFRCPVHNTIVRCEGSVAQGP